MSTALVVMGAAQTALNLVRKSRDPGPAVLLAISRMLEAVQRQIALLDAKLDIVLGELERIQATLERLPTAIEETRAHVDLYAALQALEDHLAQHEGPNPPPRFFERLHERLEEIQSARRAFDVLTQLSGGGYFGGVLHLVAALDGELTVLRALLTDEAHQAGHGVSGKAVLTTLERYRSFYERALDPSLTSSVRAIFDATANELRTALSYGQARKHYEHGSQKLVGDSEVTQCLEWNPHTGACYEPGATRTLYYEVVYELADLPLPPRPPDAGRVDRGDVVAFRYQVSASTDYQLIGRGRRATDRGGFPEVQAHTKTVNAWVRSYYAVLAVHSVCVEMDAYIAKLQEAYDAIYG